MVQQNEDTKEITNKFELKQIEPVFAFHENIKNPLAMKNHKVVGVRKFWLGIFGIVPYQHYTNAIEGYFNVLKSRLQKKKGLTYDELVNNVKDVLQEIPIHIYKNLIKGAYDRSEKYVKRPSTRKRKPKKYLD